MKFAVVPACGQSRRMGQPKLTLPLGSHTVIEQVVKTLLNANVDIVLVITGPHLPIVSQLSEKAGATVLVLPQPTPDMRSTVVAGLAYLQDRFNPDPLDPWLLMPSDHPAIMPSTVCQLLESIKSEPSISITVPAYKSQRGHPIVMRWSHVKGLQQMPSDLGINAYIRLHEAETLEIPVGDPGIHVNMNTPEDLLLYR